MKSDEKVLQRTTKAGDPDDRWKGSIVRSLTAGLLGLLWKETRQGPDSAGDSFHGNCTQCQEQEQEQEQERVLFRRYNIPSHEMAGAGAEARLVQTTHGFQQRSLTENCR